VADAEDNDCAGGADAAREETEVRVAITATGPSPDSAVDPRFGRAAFFIAMDTDSGDWTVHDNFQNLNALQGAGIQAAQNVAALGVEAVVTGNVGPKAFTALEAAGIPVYLASGGTVAEATAALRAGKLAAAAGANVTGHWQT
jgi:predicted Fe-Mo cluster-binding NifX family protein